MSKPFKIINLDKPRKLRYGMNALVTIEELSGKPLTAFDLKSIGFKDMRTIIYAGLIHEDDTLTPEKVGDLVDEFGDINEVAKIMGEAITEAFGKPKNNQGRTVKK